MGKLPQHLTPGRLLGKQQLPVEGLGRTVAALLGIDLRQEEADGVHVAVRTTEDRLGHRKGPLKQRLGLAVPTVAVIEVPKIGEDPRRQRAPRRVLLQDRQGLFECLFGLVPAPLRLVGERQPPECLGLGYSRSPFRGGLRRCGRARLPL